MNDVSEKQLQVNRTNAQLGGVKTDTGKAISARNTITHGIRQQLYRAMKTSPTSQLLLN